MRFYNSRPIPKGFTIKACTVRKRQDGWHISLRIEDKSVPEYRARPLEQVTKIIGCEGITKLVHLSDGYQIENPKFSTALRIPVALARGVSTYYVRSKDSHQIGYFTGIDIHPGVNARGFLRLTT